jgi:hypothetical protein
VTCPTATQLKRIRLRQQQVAAEAESSEKELAAADARSTSASERQAARAVRSDFNFSKLKGEEQKQRDKLQDIMSEFRANADPVRRS